MNASTHWLSRIAPRPDIDYKTLVVLGSLDPYGQHQALCQLFDLPPKEQRVDQPTPFLFRYEQQNGLPLFYVLSPQEPVDKSGIWEIASPKHFAPDMRSGDRLAFKLRVNPTVARGGVKDQRGKRHDVVMDAKLRMGWKDLPMKDRPSLAHVAYEAGVSWLLGRQERLGARFDEHELRVNGYRNWRQRTGKGITLSTLDYEGTLTVTDADRFVAELFKGIGPAKAFGCGLLLVRRIG